MLGLASLALAPASSSYVPGGKTWPGGTVRYYNAAADQAWPVARAAWVWNNSGARVRFVPSSRADAQLVIERFPHGNCVAHAKATLGFGKQARVWLPRIDETSELCNSYTSAHAVAHEFGHVLGLTHEERGCALMNPTGTWRGPKLCPTKESWEWRCGLLEEDDVRGAVALYGGRVSTIARDCPVYDAIRAPARVVAQAYPGQGIELRFGRPGLPAVPRFLAVAASSTGGYGFSVQRDRCPTDVATARRYRWSVKVGEETRIAERTRLEPGRYCYAVWAVDGLGRPSALPARAWVTVVASAG